MHGNVHLILMAAGLGSRYGGLKQMESVGRQGEWIMDYSLRFAASSGASKAVLVIQSTMKETIEGHTKALGLKDLDVQTIPQLIPTDLPIPSNRTKPLGTGQAVLCAKPLVNGPFLVLNGDDFYAKEVVQALVQTVAQDGDAMGYCAGYRLKNTLSPHGPVSRAICQVDTKGKLLGIQEHTRIVKDGDSIMDLNSPQTPLDPESLVSVNAWAFRPGFWDILEEGFEAFVKESVNLLHAEYYLPHAVQLAIQSYGATIQVLPVAAPYYGLTYPEDREEIRSFFTQSP